MLFQQYLIIFANLMIKKMMFTLIFCDHKLSLNDLNEEQEYQ